MTCGHKANGITPLIAWRRGIERGSTRDLPRKKHEKGPLRQSVEHWNRFKGNAGEPVRDGVERILTL